MMTAQITKQVMTDEIMASEVTVNKAVMDESITAGSIASAASGAFHFPQGIAGFSEAREYGFIYHGQGDIICMQSIDQPEAAFLITPWDAGRLGCKPNLSAELCHCLKLEQQDQIMWMLVLNPFADKQWVTANMKAPLALNLHDRLGLQCIRQEADLDIRYPWMPQPG